MAWSTPHSDAAPWDPVVLSWVTAPSGVLFRGPFPLTANEGLELLLGIFLGSQVPTSASWEREVLTAFLVLHGDQRAQVRSVFLQLHSQSLRLPNMYQVLF